MRRLVFEGRGVFAELNMQVLTRHDEPRQRHSLKRSLHFTLSTQKWIQSTGQSKDSLSVRLFHHIIKVAKTSLFD